MQIDWRGQEFTREIEQDLSRLMFRGGEMILNEAKRSMARPKHGKKRAHKRLKSGRISGKQWSRWQQTRRSAPGESPAVQTGRLASSLTHGAKEGGIEKLSATRWRIGTNVPYAEYLFKGTPGGKIKPRPTLIPAMEKMKSRIQALFNRE